MKGLELTSTAIVVDSTADLPPILAAHPNVGMVPLNVHFGEDVYRDWVDLDPLSFYARMRAAEHLPKTSQPAVGAFVTEYRRLRQRYAYIYSLHISGKLSGTLASTRLAQQEMEWVVVLDTGLACLPISLLADRVLGLLEKGTTEEEFIHYVERYRDTSGLIFTVDSLEYLLKGGRIGRAHSIAGSLLNIRPLLTITQGEVGPYRRVRGERRALDAVREYLLERTKPSGPIYAAIAHADAPHHADDLRSLLDQVDRQITLRFIGLVGSVIGTYTGPGASALFFVQE